MLELYAWHGIEITKPHRAIIRQEKYLAPCINMCAKKRAAAKNDFEKDLYKIMTNAVFGKTMQNVRDQHDLRIPHRHYR